MNASTMVATLRSHNIAARRATGQIVQVWDRDANGWVTTPCSACGLADWLGR